MLRLDAGELEIGDCRAERDSLEEQTGSGQVSVVFRLEEDTASMGQRSAEP